MPTQNDPRDLPPGLRPAWSDAPRPRRGPKPSHTVAAIVAAAVELADEEGLAAASLPNIAASLGLTTNALYRYVGSKDELVVLLADAGFGPPPADLGAAGDWRATVRAWTHAALERYRSRPWLLDVPFRGGAVTPHRLRWTELLLTALDGAGLSDVDALGCARLVTDFARTAAERQRALDDPHSADAPEQAEELRAFLQPLLADRGYPRLAALAAAGRYPAATTVEFGLDRVLDGIAGLLTGSRR
ncbi:TetR/AcrR family transcriptional regulator [Amycolatopsis saalfeldensis]|uniref:DNA-binding transcriptional regulator, AcrR family n=1 Tax=Amycolatopsis saalfeldensis TaxID=394193 RepID=A0A1H8PXL7_9PSEU|nr:TetR/AcrR family transcriptional regulator [Amycolatopsis saalfeldensis]SEO46685.1 DNA-binding transcriptional regulator, AcrR family [Amycolatopsis saalfeldensis]